MKLLRLMLVLGMFLSGMTLWAQTPKTFEIIADHDNTFKVTGSKKAVINLKAGEVIKLRITGHKGTEAAKDGTVHSLTIKSLKDQG